MPEKKSFHFHMFRVFLSLFVSIQFRNLKKKTVSRTTELILRQTLLCIRSHTHTFISIKNYFIFFFSKIQNIQQKKIVCQQTRIRNEKNFSLFRWVFWFFIPVSFFLLFSLLIDWQTNKPKINGKKYLRTILNTNTHSNKTETIDRTVFCSLDCWLDTIISKTAKKKQK